MNEKCTICGKELEKSEEREYGDEIYCLECLEDLYNECDATEADIF